VTAWACSGNPSDCRQVWRLGRCWETPELVLSGINHGPNLAPMCSISHRFEAMERHLEGCAALAAEARRLFRGAPFRAAPP